MKWPGWAGCKSCAYHHDYCVNDDAGYWKADSLRDSADDVDSRIKPKADYNVRTFYFMIIYLHDKYAIAQ